MTVRSNPSRAAVHPAARLARTATGPARTATVRARTATDRVRTSASPVASRPKNGLALAALALAILAAGPLAGPLAGQSNGERILNDRYTRSHDYDLVHQRIEVRDFDWDSTSLDGRVTTIVRSLRPALDSVILDAGTGLEIRSVTAPTGGRFRYDERGDTLVVHLAEPAAFGDTIRFTVEYHARIDNGQGLTFIESEGRSHRPRQIWSQGEEANNHDWFPTYDFPNDKMTWELVATVPGEYTAVSNGALVADRRNEDGTRTMHWSQAEPSATYLVSLIVAPLAQVHDEWNGTPVDYYVYPEDEPLARPLFDVTPDMIQVYSDLTGVAYPWAKYAQITVADFFGGMENVSATTLVDWLPDATAYADRPWYQWILIPHELAHQWFGDYVTTENWANMWLNEGFAEFLPGQYWRVRAGEHAGEDYYLDEWDQYISIERRRSMPLASMGSNNVYPKGALVLEMLHDYVGDAPFWAAIHQYLADHALDNATSDDLRQAFLDATGENLDWFFDEWVYGAGHPAFTVTDRWDPGTKRLLVVARQTQGDTATADSTGRRFETAEAFRMPVTVRVGTASGDVVASDWIDQRVDTITVEGVESEPTMVVFDDGNRILKSLDYSQSTARLATQLRKDPNLWNRAWVVDRLAERTDDPAAARALADAATSADYFLTRARAAEALGALPAERSLPPLREAVKDTSAQVRAAAVEALGRLGGAEAADMALEAFSRDSSYAVRAAAVIAVARSDPDRGRAVMREALSSRSYRDVIRQAAFQAIAGLNDTTFVGTMAELIGEDSNAAGVLGVLAARGNVPALDALVAALDDARPYVRRWALRSLANRVPPKLALPRLKAAATGLEHEDTREAVEQVVQRLEGGRGR